jgi:hypothetical protein
MFLWLDIFLPLDRDGPIRDELGDLGVICHLGVYQIE